MNEGTARWCLVAIAAWAIGALLGTWWQTGRFIAREHARFGAAFDGAYATVVQRLDQNEALLDGLVALLRSSRTCRCSCCTRTTAGMIVLTKQTSLPLPAVDTVSSIWDFSIGSTGLASPLVESTYTVTSVDAGAGTLTRIRTSDQRVDSFRNNDPQPGLRSRAANSCSVNGVASSCAGIVLDGVARHRRDVLYRHRTAELLRRLDREALRGNGSTAMTTPFEPAGSAGPLGRSRHA